MIIGLTGTHGAGKGTVSRILIRLGLIHLRFSDIIRQECNLKNLRQTRKNLIDVSFDLVSNYGKDYVAKELSKKIENGKSYVLDGIRRVDEINFLRSKFNNFYVIAIDADPKLRYERIIKRNESTDHLSYNQFIELEDEEMSNKENMEIKKCIGMADYKIENYGTYEELKKEIETILAFIINK